MKIENCKFEYTRPELTLEAYGEKYVMPIKTAVLIDSINKATAAIGSAKTAIEQVAALKTGIAIFIGDVETNRIFPDNETADTDEISAFWIALNECANRFSKTIAEKYKPAPMVRK